jgi:hypothetical protein
LDKWRLVDAEVDAIRVASVELIGGADIGSAELPGNKQFAGAQRRHVDVGGVELAGAAELANNTGLAGYSVRGACQRHAESGWVWLWHARGGWLREFETGKRCTRSTTSFLSLLL